MTSLPEQLSAASTRQLSAQLDAQFRFFNTFATQTLDNASRIMSLNLSASRDSVERSSHTLRQLIEATQPRDLLVLRTHAEEQVRSLFNYGRELFNITANAQPVALRTIAPEAPGAPLTLAAPASAPLEQAATAAAAATTATIDAVADTGAKVTEAVQAAAAPVVQAQAPAEPVVVQEEPAIVSADEIQATIGDDPAPVAKPKPIAKAAGKGAPKAATAPHPMAAPVEDKDSATVTRIDTPPKRRK
ncbi:phasin family protein [Massilia oculi]|uniref:phasin family protein n=1 Tax=Massilia oculi TaxID=945844 RepID=UPI001AAE4F5C|nr:phasin family protein [Massilia oculi]